MSGQSQLFNNAHRCVMIIFRLVAIILWFAIHITIDFNLHWPISGIVGTFGINKNKLSSSKSTNCQSTNSYDVKTCSKARTILWIVLFCILFPNYFKSSSQFYTRKSWTARVLKLAIKNKRYSDSNLLHSIYLYMDYGHPMKA